MGELFPNQKDNMNLEEVGQLINIRNYIYNSINNHAIERSVVNELNGMLILIDKKIVNLLCGEAFKDYIDYKDVKKAIQEVAVRNNIKSGLKQ